MARIEKFEDILSWKKARELARLIYQVSKTGLFARDFGLRDQTRRAAVSILSNIAEGFERGGDREFQQFLYMAKGSCAELRAQLDVAFDAVYITQSQIDELQSLSIEVSRLLSGMASYLSESSLAGRKFKPSSPNRSHAVPRPVQANPPTRDSGL
jgi:four helix bundle protein